MLISSLHNDDLLICMPQKNNNNKITNTFKNIYTYLSFVDCEFKNLPYFKKARFIVKLLT
jgi:hypothetical protein